MSQSGFRNPDPRTRTYSGAGGVAAQPAVTTQYATFWQRFLNYIIDILIIEVPLSIIRVPLASTFIGKAVVAGIIIAAITAVYEIGTVATWGQTLGMRVMKIRVVREEDRGPLPLERVAARSVAFWIFHLFFFSIPIFAVVRLLCDIAFLSMLWDDRKQGWHDKLGRALVVPDIPVS